MHPQTELTLVVLLNLNVQFQQEIEQISEAVEINVDQEFCKCSMLPKLETFHYKCLLPEIIDPMHTIEMEIRNPHYIMQAQSRMHKKK